MKQFDLQEYLKNPQKKIVTRDGERARIICTDRNPNYPIVALVGKKNYFELLYNKRPIFWRRGSKFKGFVLCFGEERGMDKSVPWQKSR